MPAAKNAENVSSIACRYTGGSGANDNDPVIETGNVLAYNTFMLFSTAGAMDVTVCLDGSNFSTDPLSLQDLGALSTTPVIVTSPGRIFAFRGTFERILVSQNGAIGVANAVLMCSRL